jgi:hypothetical protein
MSATICLKGGLGNQLFQIFSVWGICKFNDYTFYLNKNSVCPSVRKILNNLIEELNTNFHSSPSTNPSSIHQHRFSQYSQVVLKKEDVPHVLFNGYFQSFYFFENYRDVVFDYLLKQQDPTIMNKVDSIHNSIRLKHPNKQLVFVHRRKGDYQHPVHNGYYAILSFDYYRKAFAEFDQENTCFVVFSDDPENTQKEFDKEFPNVTKVYTHDDHSVSNDYIDLLLMSKMDGAIIANSTFSCWGAYLMDFHRTKTVVAPKYWFAEWNTHRLDFFEKHWKLIENTEVYQNVAIDPKRS